ncbi:manganese transporter, partial [Burkholderia contaminans]
RVVEPGVDRSQRDTWRMPPLETLEPQKMTLTTRVWMAVLRGYLVIAVGLVIVKVVQMTLLK